jgi:hypothetical protein
MSNPFQKDSFVIQGVRGEETETSKARKTVCRHGIAKGIEGTISPMF